jgi:DNA-binding response OmpR family regulator
MQLVEKVNYTKPALREKQPFVADDDTGCTSPAISGSGRKVLVVDDNPVVLKACELKLKANGFEVLTASDPSTGISLAREEAPDAIVLDLNFPVGKVFSSFNWDGVQILRWLKHCEKVAGVPVIILTGDESEKNKQLALAEGAVAHFQKPVDWKVFAGTLANLIDQKRRA